MGRTVVAVVVEPGRRDDVDPGARGELGKLVRVAPGVGRHRVDDGLETEIRCSTHLRRHRVDVAEVEIRLHQHRPPAVDDDVLVAVRDPERGWVDVAEDRPDERHATASAGSSRTAPAARSCSCRIATGTWRGSVPAAIAMAAAVPAAWPMAMHCAIDRTDACASCVAEKQRPATSTFAASRTTSAR